MGKGSRKRAPREKDLTARLMHGHEDEGEDRLERHERYAPKNAQVRQSRVQRTSDLRQSSGGGGDDDALPMGQVMQVYSLFCLVRGEGKDYLCVWRKTQRKLNQLPMSADGLAHSGGAGGGLATIVVGDHVRFRPSGTFTENGRPEAVVERVQPRDTILTRQNSFNAAKSAPIVANAKRMLIVASLLRPRIKWGLIDRMVIAAQTGGLEPMIVVNKIDLASEPEGLDELQRTQAILDYYQQIGIPTLLTSASQPRGVEELGQWLSGSITVLAGHSGVGKSSLIMAVDNQLDLRVGEVSLVNEKGRHTTTSARWYELAGGGAVIDTPGVKQFGLWNVTRYTLEEYFPDITAGHAPLWRNESYQKILESLGKS